MRTAHRFALSSLLVAGVALTVLSGAFAGHTAEMHPELAARLAGMGEHGVVNLQLKAKSGKLCWTFDMGKLTGFTGASIHAGQKTTALVRLGTRYATKGCVKASAMTLEHLESKPSAYWVFVDTKGHPGDLRGKLFAGMAHM